MAKKAKGKKKPLRILLAERLVKDFGIELLAIPQRLWHTADCHKAAGAHLWEAEYRIGTKSGFIGSASSMHDCVNAKRLGAATLKYHEQDMEVCVEESK